MNDSKIGIQGNFKIYWHLSIWFL